MSYLQFVKENESFSNEKGIFFIEKEIIKRIAVIIGHSHKNPCYA